MTVESQPQGTDRKKSKEHSGAKLLDRKRLKIGAVSFGAGVAAIVLHDHDPETIGAALMFALAALLAGGFAGFLFGIPRALDDHTPHDHGSQPAARPVGYVGNTNLEQISDWLTKIIVGVTLTQLGAIREGAASLFDAMSPALGAKPDSAVFAAGLTIYYAVVGFIVGWLATRIFLGRALTSADQVLDLLNQADQADQAGSTDTARQLRRRAADLLAASRTTLAEDETTGGKQAPGTAGPG